MKYIVAVSGGVDSVVLLDMLVRAGEHEIIVAHFDHGIRGNSADDARFVKALAKIYDLPYEGAREELGADVSEEVARSRRYEFLRSLAKKFDAHIVTAHHQDDVIETVAINLTRGTGWRGLAVMSASDVFRPLIGMRKREIYEYALTRGLEFVEDETNRDSRYLRNRIRVKLSKEPVDRTHIVQLIATQYDLKVLINEETARYGDRFDRYFFIMQDDVTALEILRRLTNAKLTTPQRSVLLRGIKSASPGATYELGGGVRASFTSTDFAIEMPE